MSLPLHPDLSDDLAVLAGAGLGEDAAAATAAVRLLADAYRAAWEYGDLPYGAPGRVQITTRITTHG
ncbi:hypothetical protein [Streptomyces sp. IBSBF 2435]|uniref:hypothetical protein n=1 Tax=Streptomyces sp. IBSBF 2435 TaxID=2903531 RepID=UPI002FDC4144